MKNGKCRRGAGFRRNGGENSFALNYTGAWLSATMPEPSGAPENLRRADSKQSTLVPNLWPVVATTA